MQGRNEARDEDEAKDVHRPAEVSLHSPRDNGSWTSTVKSRALRYPSASRLPLYRLYPNSNPPLQITLAAPEHQRQQHNADDNAPIRKAMQTHARSHTHRAKPALSDKCVRVCVKSSQATQNAALV